MTVTEETDKFGIPPVTNAIWPDSWLSVAFNVERDSFYWTELATSSLEL